MAPLSSCLPNVYSGGWTDKCIVEKAVRSKRFIDREHIKTHQGGCWSKTHQTSLSGYRATVYEVHPDVGII